MSTQITPVSKRTAKPTAAGILDILAGSFWFLGALGMGIIGTLFGHWGGFPFILSGLFWGILAVPMAVIGILAIAGGVFTLLRKNWGWALAGSIAAILVSHVFGIIATILIVLSKDEFEA
jgi:hypothetical protein